MSNLAQYETLIDWAINSHSLEDTPTDVSRKNVLLAEINAALQTNYSEQHLNNWLANRKPTPRWVWRHLVYMLLDVEVGYENSDLSANLVRLMQLK